MLSLRKGMGALLLATFTLAALLASRQIKAQHIYVTKLDNWIDWNIMFKESSDSIQRQSLIDDLTSQIAAVPRKPIIDVEAKKGKITSYLRKVAGKNARNYYITRITYRYCNNGDRLVANLTADAEVRALDSTSTQPGSTSPKPVVKPSGAGLAYLELNHRLEMRQDSYLKVNGLATLLSFPPNTQIQKDAVIAILDSGIDTALYAEGFRSELLWNGPSGSKNMVDGGDVDNYMDNYAARHGTAVAAIALNSYYMASDTTAVPKLMVVKVLNDRGEGTVFDLCCGLNYAANNHATVINASLGYIHSDASQQDNESLEYYLEKCRADSIPVVAAAGNTNEKRVENQYCQPNTAGTNLMNTTNMFLPASYARDPNRFSVISVTGVGQPGVACYYQNSSDQFVSVGVLNQKIENNCCSYKLPFFFRTVEGTSYATPVVSGRLAWRINRLGHRTSNGEYMRQLNVLNAPASPTGVAQATQGNQYITY